MFNTRYKRDSIIKREINNLPSETVQGESYTIRELFQKHTLPNIGFIPEYDENPDIDNSDFWRNPDFDLSDTDHFKKDLETKKEDFLKSEAKKQQDAQQKHIDEIVNKRLAKLQEEEKAKAERIAETPQASK